MTRRAALRSAAAALSVLLLVLLARRVDWAQSWAIIRQASLPLLLVAGVANVSSLLLRGTRWWLFVRASGFCSLGLALRSAVVGSGLSNVLPMGGGDAGRVVFIARGCRLPPARVLASLAIDRLLDVLSAVMLMVLFSLAGALPATLSRLGRDAGLAAAALGLLVLPVLVYLRVRYEGGSAPAASDRWSWLRAHVAHFVGGLVELPTARRLGPALALSLAAWGLQWVTYHLTARSVGLPISWLASGAAMLAVNVTFLFPVTPGNVGVFQLVYALVMGAFGLPQGAAVGAALLIQALQILPVTAAAALLAPDLVLHPRRAAAEARKVESR